MIIYFFFFILSLLPLIEGEGLGLARFLLLSSCFPWSIYLLKKKKITLNLVFYLFFLFLTLALISTLISPVFQRSFNILVLYFVYLIYFLLSQALFKENKPLFKKGLNLALLFPSLSLTLLSFYLLSFKDAPAIPAMNLIFPSFGHNHLVDFLVLSFPLSLFLFLKEENRVKKGLFFLLNLIYLAGFILSFSRGGFLLLLFIAGCFFLKLKKTETSFFKKISLKYVLFLGVFVFLLISLSLFSSLFLEENQIRSEFFQKFTRSPSHQSRLEYWHQSFLSFKEKPIFGWGLDNFRYLSKKYQSQSHFWSWYSHNHFLQLFSETGFLGGLCFLGLILLSLKRIFLTSVKDEFNLNWALKISVLASILQSLFDFNWQFSSVFLLFWVILGFLIKDSEESRETKEYLPKLKPYFLMFFVFIAFLIFLTSFLELKGSFYYFKAREYEENNQFTKASFYYEKVLTSWPFKLERWKKIIEYYQDQGDLDKALAVSQKLGLKEPLNGDNYLVLGDLYFEKNDFLKAIQAYEKAVLMNPQQGEKVYLKIVELYLENNLINSKEIIRVLTNLETLKQERCLLLCLGKESEENVNSLLIKLIQQDDEFNKLNPKEQAKVYFWLTILNIHQQNWEEPISYIKKAVKIDNNLKNKEKYQVLLDELLLIQAIDQSYQSNNFNEAETLAFKLIKTPLLSFYQKFYLAKANNILGEIMLRKEDYLKAEEYFLKAIEINPWDQDFYLNLSFIYVKSKKNDKKEMTLNKCLDFNPWSQKCLRNLNK
ncbi:hypothetical protein COT75_00900 [Candidatus Beckwithbacteria bacterium CG10_big_fil_rev_8_21_14_0_10_34_10]|uniref:O-antigen ligase-related domain-containing protein n=1 Tax=Candidatus Beckwithbacteria bacterium CG10_big_fil_rev_8_21_14_0_10_34_10 TaxID=1974495 RepID=A0A2H0WA58_9BACT|nr:MAG: hypothetical protein COT75_00900 [Candidatus Beckwithbacteria bacterium CG10_big_fil_rev_8_21_14_0_10_34_10]